MPIIGSAAQCHESIIYIIVIYTLTNLATIKRVAAKVSIFSLILYINWKKLPIFEGKKVEI